ncbi:MAG: hypothetical protein GXO60_00390 [Epsilonproteobacteria bacterium]|nr:hypothetical protein [Campylobacterota bacterium]
MNIFKAVKFYLNRLLISLKLKKERYKWYLPPTQPTYGKAIFVVSNKKRLKYKEYIEKLKEEEELNQLITTINEFLDVQENSDDYKTFVAKEYKNQGYTVWEYSRDKNIKDSNNQFDLLLKKRHNIILVQCRDDKINIGIDEINNFEKKTVEFIEENKIFEHYNIKLRYTMSGLFLEEEAYEYIKENAETIDYDILKIK